MTTIINDVGTRIMNEHGVYPLLDTLTNDALLPTVGGDDMIGRFVYLYVDAKGLHLVWRPVKKDRKGNAVRNGGNLLVDTRSVDVTAEFAAKLDYDGASPDFSDTAKTNDDDPWFITGPEVGDVYVFALCGLKDDKGTHLSHIFATDGEHKRLLLAPDSETQMVSLEHTVAALALNGLPSDDTTRLETDADILSKAKELLK